MNFLKVTLSALIFAALCASSNSYAGAEMTDAQREALKTKVKEYIDKYHDHLAKNVGPAKQCVTHSKQVLMKHEFEYAAQLRQRNQLKLELQSLLSQIQQAKELRDALGHEDDRYKEIFGDE
jgi:hypothetical protein